MKKECIWCGKMYEPPEYLIKKSFWLCRACMSVHRKKSRDKIGRARANAHLIKFRDKERFGGLRDFIFKRDGYQCQFCNMSSGEHKDQYGRSLVIHHLDTKGRGKKCPNNNPNNLILMCLSCHTKLHRKLRLDKCTSLVL